MFLLKKSGMKRGRKDLHPDGQDGASASGGVIAGQTDHWERVELEQKEPWARSCWGVEIGQDSSIVSIEPASKKRMQSSGLLVQWLRPHLGHPHPKSWGRGSNPASTLDSSSLLMCTFGRQPPTPEYLPPIPECWMELLVPGHLESEPAHGKSLSSSQTKTTF